MKNYKVCGYVYSENGDDGFDFVEIVKDLTWVSAGRQVLSMYSGYKKVDVVSIEDGEKYLAGFDQDVFGMEVDDE